MDNYRIVVYPASVYVQQEHRFLFWRFWDFISYPVGVEGLCFIRKRFEDIAAAQKWIDERLVLRATLATPPVVINYPAPAAPVSV